MLFTRFSRGDARVTDVATFLSYDMQFCPSLPLITEWSHFIFLDLMELEHCIRFDNRVFMRSKGKKNWRIYQNKEKKCLECAHPLVLTHTNPHTKNHYPANVCTFHSSQLPPIHPQAFRKSSGVQKKKERERETVSLQHRQLVEIKVVPRVDVEGLRTPHNAVQSHEIMQIKGLITTSLVWGVQLAAITLSVNLQTKAWQLDTNYTRFHGR